MLVIVGAVCCLFVCLFADLLYVCRFLLLVVVVALVVVVLVLVLFAVVVLVVIVAIAFTSCPR